MNWIEELKKKVNGEVLTNKKILDEYSYDTSIFKVKPEAVVFPKDANDVKKIVKFVNEKKKNVKDLSITARAGGTDMTGGPLNESIILCFTRYFNKIRFMNKEMAVVQPGVYYRDFEKKADKLEVMLPSYPASKSICALGGMISNNSGGEKTIVYGQTNQYVKKLRVVLSDGNEYEFRKINEKELKNKMKKRDFEGQIYRKMYNLLEKNYKTIQKSRPKVPKNSAGYYLWNVWDKKDFDLTQLFAGAQGTLGMITEAELKLVKKKRHSRLITCYIYDNNVLLELVNLVLPYKPESMETFDDATLKLALRFMPEIAKKLGRNLMSLLFSFRKEGIMTMLHGLPKFVVLVELVEDNEEELLKRIDELHLEFGKRKIRHITMKSKEEGEKYWTMRRESFNLLRNKVKDKKATAFIDDFCVPPESFPEFIPKLYEIMEPYKINPTIAGHAGSGNFHIIPLMDLSKKSERMKIPELSEKVYDLVLKYNGSITAEHNDGLIRSPYLEKMFGKKMIRIFEEVKKIFDPKGIFNPGKKVRSSMKYVMKHIKTVE